jgi:hypothetical protein
LSKYRKKPVVIEAQRFKSWSFDHMQSLVAWINSAGQKGAWHNGEHIFIETLEGRMKADVGDWIIRGVKGEHYPCKHDIFEATYEGC